MSPMLRPQQHRTPALYSKALAAATLGTSLVLAPALIPGGIAPIGTSAAQAAPAETWPLIVTEIAPNNTGDDNFEYIEVTNTTKAPLTIGKDGYQLAYIYADSTDRTKDVPLTTEAPIQVAAGETLTLWLAYTDKAVDSSAHTVEEFRANWGMDASARVEKIGGQNGMANGGSRGIRVSNAAGQEVSRSFYPKDSADIQKTIHFRTPIAADQLSMDVFQVIGAPTAGKIAPEQILDRSATAPVTPTPPPTTSAPSAAPTATVTTPPATTTAPTPAPTTPAATTTAPTAAPTSPAPTVAPTTAVATPTATPSAPTAAPTTPAPTTKAPTPAPTTSAPTPAPTTAAPAPAQPISGPSADTTVGQLLISELVPDSENVGTSDGFEYIEIYNPTTQPINLRDYQLSYLYPSSDLVITNAATWPMSPEDHIVEPGKTVVVWVKNGPNDALTVEDFAKNYGVAPASLNIVETHTAGMANGSLRGMEIQTRTGHTVNRVFYNNGTKDVAKNRGIHYTVDQNNFAVSTIANLAPATPGTVADNQHPTAPVVLAADSVKPTIVNNSPSSIDPAKDAALSFTITDNVQVRRATLTLRSSAEEKGTVHELLEGKDGSFTFTIPQADLMGKEYFEYTLEVSDGTNISTLKKVRVPLAGVNTAPARLNVTEGQFVRGTTALSLASNASTDSRSLCVDSTTFTTTAPALEKAPAFAFEASQTDTYFRNGVLVNGDVLTIFDQGFYSNWNTVSTDVPLTYVKQGKPLQVDIAAGTKAKPGIDENENNDDFTVRNVRLVLPDGRTLRAPGWDNPEQIIQMGDSAGKVEILNAKFDIPSDAYTAVAAQWDTTKVADGKHVVCGIVNGNQKVETTVFVDNTAPEITTNLVDGSTMQGEFPITFAATDSGSGIESVSALFDGKPIKSGETRSSLTLAAGKHTLTIVSRDKAGNESTREVTISTPVEQPSATLGTNNGAELSVCVDPALTATVTDPSNDTLNVSFRQGFSSSFADGELSATAGSVHDADAATRSGHAATVNQAVTATDALPFEQFETNVPAGATKDSQVRVSWSGVTNPGARVRLLVWNTETKAWEQVAVTITDSASGEATLQALVPLTGHAADGKIKALVQHSEGWAGPDLSTRSSAVTTDNANDTPRSDYDYTLVWESDTQYYNEEFYQHQLNIHDYYERMRTPMNIQYGIHTGDIVDESDKPYQWVNADKAYKVLDDSLFPYGVLAGNHDVAHLKNDYTEYSKYFGASRYSSNPWYGESHKDNRGHYDLITAGGQDYLMLYMGWAPGDEEIAWMNEILARYPERVAFVNLHEYMLTTGGLGPIPQRIYDEVVAKNPNVHAVLSGHYHDAYTRTDMFDDNGDGIKERAVTAMLFDYQGLPEGGEGYLRLLHFDNEGKRMIVRTYSPSKKVYDSTDPTLDMEHQEFSVSYDALGIKPAVKSLATHDLTIDVLAGTEFGAYKNVASGSTVGVAGTSLPSGNTEWYTVVSDPHGAVSYSEVRKVSVASKDCSTTATPVPSVQPSATPTAASVPSVQPSATPTAAPSPTLVTPTPAPAPSSQVTVIGQGSAPVDTSAAMRSSATPTAAASSSARSTTAPAAKPVASSQSAAKSHTTLPRTGAEVLGVLIAAVVLVGGGIALMRVRRPRK